MNQKLSNVNCQCEKNGVCLHDAVARNWFGKTKCILVHPPKDPRMKDWCALQYKYTGHGGKPMPPPGRVIRLGISHDTLIPPDTTEDTGNKHSITMHKGDLKCQYN